MLFTGLTFRLMCPMILLFSCGFASSNSDDPGLIFSPDVRHFVWKFNFQRLQKELAIQEEKIQGQSGVMAQAGIEFGKWAGNVMKQWNDDHKFELDALMKEYETEKYSIDFEPKFVNAFFECPDRSGEFKDAVTACHIWMEDRYTTDMKQLQTTKIDNVSYHKKLIQLANDKFVEGTSERIIRNVLAIDTTSILDEFLTLRLLRDEEEKKANEEHPTENVDLSAQEVSIVEEETVVDNVNLPEHSHGSPAQATNKVDLMKTLQEGDGVRFPKDHDTLMIFYKGFLSGSGKCIGECFDETGTDNEYPVVLNSGANIVGLEIALKQMSKGQKCRFYIPSHQGYGAYGAPGLIPPNTDLIFDLTLVSICETADVTKAVKHDNDDIVNRTILKENPMAHVEEKKEEPMDNSSVLPMMKKLQEDIHVQASKNVYYCEFEAMSSLPSCFSKTKPRKFELVRDVLFYSDTDRNSRKVVFDFTKKPKGFEANIHEKVIVLGNADKQKVTLFFDGSKEVLREQYRGLAAYEALSNIYDKLSSQSKNLWKYKFQQHIDSDSTMHKDLTSRNTWQ